MQDSVIAVFRKCDVNGTGCIHTSTLRRLLRVLNESYWSDANIQVLIDAHGKSDGDMMCYEDFFQWLFLDSCVMLRTPSLPSPMLHLDSWSALMAVLQSQLPGQAEAVARLLREKPEAASTLDSSGNLPVHTALRTKQPVEVLRLLLQAHPQGVRAQDEFGSLPLHLALSGDTSPSEVVADLVRFYPAGASVVDQASGMLPVHLALLQKRSEALVGVLKALLEAYVEGSVAKAPSGDRPIQLAVYLNHGPGVMEEILKAAWKCQAQQK